MFQFSSWATHAYRFSKSQLDITPTRFPDSDISGSQLVDSSPELNAVCHVFHRLLTPEHPPYTLMNLTTIPGEPGI